MSQSQLRLERLDVHHDLTVFDSGNAELDRWLRRYALPAQQMDSARTFVLRRTIASSAISAHDGVGLASRCAVQAGPWPAAYPVGMVLLARLAIAREEKGKGLGAMLLAEALRKALAAGEAAAARLVVVDAVDEAAALFCEHHGFVRAPEHPLRLYRRMKDIRASLDRP